MKAMTRALCILALLTACGRTELVPSVEILSITSAVTAPSPGQTVPVVMQVRNGTPSPLLIAEVTLFAEPALQRYTADPANPNELAPAAEVSLGLTATLPEAFDQLTIDGTILVVAREDGRVYEDRAATLPLVYDRAQPPAPAIADFVVTTLDDELDGTADLAAAGGAGDLSLREAVALANANPGPDRIEFDVALFEPLAPGIIPFDLSLGAIEVTDDETTVDATGAGAAVQVSVADDTAIGAFRVTGNRFALRGLTALGFTKVVVRILNAGSVEITDCTFLMNGSPATAAAVVYADYAPGLRVLRNQVEQGNFGIKVLNSTDIEIAENTFQTNDISILLDGVARAMVRDNRQSNGGRFLQLEQVDDSDFERNTITPNGSLCVLVQEASTNLRFTENYIEGCGNTSSEHGILIRGASVDVRLTRNLIFSSDGQAIFIDSGSNRDIAPPTVLAIGPPITGTAAGAAGSVVEVFEAPDDEAKRYIATGTVDGSGNWSAVPEAALTSGSNLNATVTDPNGSTSMLSVSFPIP